MRVLFTDQKVRLPVIVLVSFERHLVRFSAYSHGQSNLIYVTKWIDYSNRYGFGCQYNNGGVSIMHNDGTRLCLSPDRRYCRRWKGGKEYSWPTEIFDMADENWSLGESASLIRHFVGYMDSNLLAVSL